VSAAVRLPLQAIGLLWQGGMDFHGKFLLECVSAPTIVCGHVAAAGFPAAEQSIRTSSIAAVG
jgi:hypothetical protein